MIRKLAALAATGVLGWAGHARAQEVFVGAYAHNMDQYFRSSEKALEGGADIMFGVRSGRIEALRLIGAPQAHAFASINTDGTSNFVAAGLSWPIRINHRFYIRPGLGIAYTDGKAGLPPVNAPGLTPDEIDRRLHLYHTRIDFGSHVLFQPEINVGVHITDRLSAEISWVHLSNGQIFHQGKNQGLDDAGIRVIYALGARSR